VANPDFSTLADLIQSAGLEETLTAEGPYTVFAPTNTAFENLPEEVMQQLETDEEALAALLSFHVVEGELTAEDLAEMESVTTVAGTEISIATGPGGVEEIIVNDQAFILEADMEAENGVIHTVGGVLIPPENSGQ